MAFAFDSEEMESHRIRRHVFLARYGKQSVLQWADVEGREIRAYVRALAEILKEETAEVQRRADAERA